MCGSDNEDNKRIGTAVLREIVQDPSHPNYFDAAQALFHGNAEIDKRAVAPIIYKLVQDLKNINRFFLAIRLFWSANKDDKIIGEAVLKEIAQDPLHPHHFDATHALSFCATKEDKKNWENTCREIIQDPSHINYIDAAQTLSKSKNEENRTIGTRILNEIVQEGPSHPQYPEAAEAFVTMDELSDATLLNLLPALSLDGLDLEGLLLKMLESPNLEIQKQAETIFLANPLKLTDSFLTKFTAVLMQNEERKRELWLDKICEALRSSALEHTRDFNAACLILETSDQEKFTALAQTVFLKMVDTQEEEFMLHAKSLLQAVIDPDLKEKMISRLFKIAKSIDLKEVAENASGLKRLSLVILLEQNDKKIRTEAVSLCQELLASIDPSHELPERFLSGIGAVLCDVEEGKPLAQQISLLLQPEFEKIFSASDPWDENSSLVEFFMRMGNESQQLKIFNLLKESIINIEDESSTESENSYENESDDDEYNDFEDGIDIIIDALGVDHLWSQELIELGAKRASSNHKGSAFSVYKHLREQMDQSVKHLLPQLQLKDNRTVTFNLKTLQDKRKIFHLPMKHDEFVGFTKQLLAQADQHPQEFKLCATEALLINRQTAMEEVNTVFFKSLLDRDEQKKDPQTLSLISFKLRHILTAVKELELEESTGLASQGLTSSSKLILSLLNNILTCPTGKEDGIDQTYRLLTNRRGSSENELQQDRLKEEMHEFFKEEMRCLRETLLSGNGPVVRSLLKLSKESKIEEAPHQTKYLGNLLGADIGIFAQGKSITFDQNGGCILSKLRNCSKQIALDKLYQYHTPKTVIAHFNELFNSKGIMGKIDGKNTVANIMGEFLTYEQQGDSAYIVFDDSFSPIGITPLGTAEILLKTHILEVIEKD
ncbi:MAG: hypothetical protein Q8929_00155 [Bacillota bacterium]|nr:hypothetical protein [Bacillota bacterium]